MSSKKTTQTTASYNPYGMSVYNSLQGPATNTLLNDISNPWSAMQGNVQFAQGNNQLWGQTQQQNQGAVQSMTARGINPNSPLFAQQLGQLSNASSSARSGLYNNLLLNASNLQQGATMAGAGYQPLQTGNTTTQTTSGLGTWLPQVAGVGLQAATMRY